MQFCMQFYLHVALMKTREMMVEMKASFHLFQSCYLRIILSTKVAVAYQVTEMYHIALKRPNF